LSPFHAVVTKITTTKAYFSKKIVHDVCRVDQEKNNNQSTTTSSNFKFNNFSECGNGRVHRNTEERQAGTNTVTLIDKKPEIILIHQFF